jgi:ketosteroid isomerase-like protein
MAGRAVVRTKVSLAETPAGRNLQDRIVLRMPRVFMALAPVIFRRPPTSRLRQRFMRFFMLRGYAALNRGDLDILLMPYDPEVLFTVHGEARRLGLDDEYRGLAGAEKVIRDWDLAWDEHRYEPREVVDVGEQVVSLVDLVGRGRASGAEVTMPLGFVMTLRDGRIVRQEQYEDWDAALAAAGVD